MARASICCLAGAIVEGIRRIAILAGERDAEKLADMGDYRIQASEENVANLTRKLAARTTVCVEAGDGSVRLCQRQIAECDQQIQPHLCTLPIRPQATERDDSERAAAPRKKDKKAQGNSPEFPLDKELIRISGVDFTRIDGINVMTADRHQRIRTGFDALENGVPL